MIQKFVRLLSAFAIAAAFIVGDAASAQSEARSGSFVGKSGHKTSGGVSLVQTADGYAVHFAANFSLDGAPGPYIGFGNGGSYDKSTQFSKLGKLNGAQTYKVPERIDVSKYSEIYIWCKPYNVPLGVAKLQ